jgi:hypothetical protein
VAAIRRLRSSMSACGSSIVNGFISRSPLSIGLE